VVPVLFTDNEIDAELAKGALESEGIAAQVRFSARAGYPRYAAGYGGFGVRAPWSTYEVLVAEDRADDAREILAVMPERATARPGRWRVWLFRAFTIFVLVTFLCGALQQLRLLF